MGSIVPVPITPQRFAGKIVFLTGGTGGLGAATCELFLAEGASVFVVDLHAHDIASKLSKTLHFQKCDVSDPVACEEAVRACVAHFGRLDVLINCAGRVGPVTDVPGMPVEEFQKLIGLNLGSVFYLSRVAIPQMIKQGGGAVVSIASTSGLAGDYGLCAYNAAKAGVINLSRAMACDHAKDGVRVNVVCPGYMITPMSAAFETQPDMYADLLDGIPQGRGCDPKEVGRAVLWLASDEASFTTGTTLVVDGGWGARSGAPKFTKYM
ncbi:3-oxoacyl-reductase [Cryomyces antarcticus]|uniref:Uncharacterized protein n=1 Tax=Cryomyces antarcticus TaxID=329879 RepID=A0ABR0KV02_9PEZI|nr:hypothetical protein LTR39_000009 [Cryomyces antarcticus]KAK5021398.1 hypothetical protein LTR60_000014 [Cryomyces antarcticus]KAK5132137.1 hypothetical protein LTR16_000017 [Cryomyces antarcticus]